MYIRAHTYTHTHAHTRNYIPAYIFLYIYIHCILYFVSKGRIFIYLLFSLSIFSHISADVAIFTYDSNSCKLFEIEAIFAWICTTPECELKTDQCIDYSLHVRSTCPHWECAWCDFWPYTPWRPTVKVYARIYIYIYMTKVQISEHARWHWPTHTTLHGCMPRMAHLHATFKCVWTIFVWTAHCVFLVYSLASALNNTEGVP